MLLLKQLRGKECLLAAIAVATIIAQVYLDLRLPDYMERITLTISTPGNNLSDITGDGIGMILVALGSMLCAIVTGYCTAVMGTTVARRLRAAVYNHTFDLSDAEVNKVGTNSLITRSTNDVTQVQMFLVMGLQISIKSPIMAAWASSKIASESLTWTVPTALAVLAVIVIMASALSLAIPRMMRMQKITDSLNRVTREHLTGLRVIRAYLTQGFHEQRFEAVNTDLRNTTLFVNTVMSFIMPMLTAVMTGLSLAIYVLGAVLINDTADPQERLTLFSQMVVFSTYALQVVTSFMMMTVIFVMGPRALVSWRRIREVLCLEPAQKSGTVTQGTTAPGTLEFRNVSFRYPEAEADTLHGISLQVEPGQTLAIIGSTGSGKSTLVNLIPRIFDATSGTVLVNGVDVREWDTRELRNRLAHVAQKATLFSGSVASNIALGDATQPVEAESVVCAGSAATVESFVGAKEDGYASLVAQNGKNFSGGQKQRISMARALARGGDIMIFDDSFSALDFKTERTIRESLPEATAGATVVVVAQRIGTVRDADQILVLDKGRAVGLGTHEELMASNAVYQDIARSQLSEEELA